MTVTAEPDAAPAPAVAVDRRFPVAAILIALLAVGVPWMLILRLVAGPHAVAPGETRSLAEMIGLYVALLAWMAFCARRARLSWRALLGPPPSTVGLAIGLGIALLHFAVAFGTVMVVFGVFARLDPRLFSALMKMLNGVVVLDHAPLALRVLIAVVLAPFTEEFLFRGVLFHRIARLRGTTWATFVTSLIFSVMHPDPLGILVFALLLQGLYVRTRSLWTTIAAHAINNGLTLVMTAGKGDAGPPNPTLFENALLPGIVMLCALAPMSIWAIRALWPPRGARLPWEAPPPSETVSLG